jgi:hypothetical protein
MAFNNLKKIEPCHFGHMLYSNFFHTSLIFSEFAATKSQIGPKNPAIFTLGPDKKIQYYFEEDLKDAYTERSFTIVRDYFSVKSIHAFPSYVIVDLGHSNIRFYVFHEYQIIEKFDLGFGGLAISTFLVQLLKENNKEFVAKDPGFGVL